MSGYKPEVMAEIAEYFEKPKSEREPLKELKRRLHITKGTYDKYRRGYLIQQKFDRLDEIAEGRLAVIKKKEELERAAILPEKDEWLKWLEEHFGEMVEATFESAKKGNAQSQRLLAQLGNKLIEKSEVKIELGADEYFAIWAEGKRRAEGLRGEIDRDRSLLSESALLSE